MRGRIGELNSVITYRCDPPRVWHKATKTARELERFICRNVERMSPLLPGEETTEKGPHQHL